MTDRKAICVTMCLTIVTLGLQVGDPDYNIARLLPKSASGEYNPVGLKVPQESSPTNTGGEDDEDESERCACDDTKDVRSSKRLFSLLSKKAGHFGSCRRRGLGCSWDHYGAYGGY